MELHIRPSLNSRPLEPTILAVGSHHRYVFIHEMWFVTILSECRLSSLSTFQVNLKDRVVSDQRAKFRPLSKGRFKSSINSRVVRVLAALC